MKKSNLFFMMAAGAMLATSCASEQEMPEVPGSNDAGKQLIYLSVANDNGNTRAGRPLTDGAAAQDIENVKLILVKGTTVVWTKDIKDWNAGGSEAYANGRQAVVEIEKGEGENQYTLSSDDNCTLYAIGYSEGTKYDGLADVAAYKKGATFNKNITLTYTGEGFALAPLERPLDGFEAAGPDGVWHPAEAIVEGGPGLLAVTCPAAGKIEKVRYGYRPYFEATLFDNFGLPASPFITDGALR